MTKKGTIIFWITFPITALIVGLFLLFYLDLSNGPVIILVLETFAFIAAVVVRIMLRNRKIYFRMIPTIALFLTSCILLPLSKPTVKAKSAAYYDNPVATEVLQLENGQVKGVYSEDKEVEIYAGVPYAEAPVGDLRWKEPVDKKNWEGVLDCSYFGDSVSFVRMRQLKL